MTHSKTTQSLIESTSREDEVDLRQLGGALLRHKGLIGAVAGSALVLSTLYAFTRKPVWEGQFQIVLQNNEQPSSGAAALLQNNPALAGLIGSGSGESQLETEVKILESPSVLKPVFDFVKASKTKAGDDVSDWRYSDWAKSNLTIELAKGTSVLEIAYRDTQEDLILPVIDRISKAYQAYSDRDRTRGLNSAVAYLEQQIIKLTPEANSSMRAAQNYGLANDLGVKDGLGASAIGTSGDSGESSIENARNAAQNKVNALQQQLNDAKVSGSNRVYVAPQLVANAELYGQLQSIEASLQEKSSLLLPSDPSIRALQRQRRSLTLVINQQTMGLLRGELQTAQAQLASLNRPHEVIIKHRELVRAALRDEKTIAELEVQLQAMQLEQARQGEPWELISKPTLLDSPVAPNKKRIIALGLLAGLVAGSGAALVVDRRTGLVFSSDDLKVLLPCPLLKHLSALAPNSWYDAADLLANGPLNVSTNGAIALIPVGNVPSDQLRRFGSELQNALGSRELVVSSDLRQTSRCATQLLLTAPGVATRTQLSQLKQKLALQGTPLAGWILLDPELELS
ncbi:capsular exopolysaccharide family domain protein [Synechococcus sp. BIOS-U3-1]|uniref:GumC family protein n=1 Tax=Synechococcus sp. BIOS-U3-1 TaxID=1400865 RepID=UPI001644F647|nr:Wzz/FepE/Etk N-terminal domain-containing protein [Synechococcus sp. BIOS-U3-1]QNI57154.1 capsular exopolysaccharide family domain protein [Synechococcus sp. BIOS-U3-1]